MFNSSFSPLELRIFLLRILAVKGSLTYVRIVALS